MIELRNFLFKAMLLILLSIGFACGALASTPPGSRIFNIATVTYELPDASAVIVSNSNAITVHVGTQYSFVVENYHSLTSPAGFVVELPHRIVNQGNAAGNFSFSYPDFDADVFSEPVIYHDKNSNGRVDPGEPELVSIPTLLSEQSIDVVVTTRLSAQLPDGLQKDFTLLVSSEESGQTREIENSITVGEPGKLQISLSTFPECSAPLFPGDVITHTVGFEKVGAGSVNDATYLLDGEVVKGVIVEVAVKENTDYFEFQTDASGSVEGINVVKLEGAPENEWTSASVLANSTDSTEAAVVRSSGYFVKSTQLDNEGVIARYSVSHSVREARFSGNAILSTATFDADNDGLANVVSGSSCSTFSTSAAAENGGELIFVEPAPALRLAGVAPDFNRDADFVTAPLYELKRSESDPYVTVRDGMYLQLIVADEFNSNIETDSAGNRYAVVNLTSELTGDNLSVVLLETGQPGVFRSVAPIELSTSHRSDGGSCPEINSTEPVVPQFNQPAPSCVLQTGANDRLLSLFGDDETGFAIAGVIFVGRQTTIFDARTLESLAGVGVEIRRADNNQVSVNPLTNVAHQYITDADGVFTLPRLRDEVEYYLHVSPPDGYQFPSSVPPYLLTDFSVHGFSYGRDGYTNSTTPIGLQNDASTSGVFLGVVLNNEETIDIPLDGNGTGRLLAIDKIATQSTVDIGQSLSYLVTVKNTSGEDLTEVVVTDTLPFGFRYVANTAAIAGVVTSNPVPTGDGDLLFEMGSLAAGQTSVLSYTVRATAAATDSSGINTAVAAGVTAARRRSESLPSTAKVTLQRGGVFSSKAALFGKIYVDQNCDGLQNNKEWPIGGVRLYLQDGTYVVSDADGQYSLYGLDPGNYVIKVDDYTLPEGLDLKLLSPDQSADASSRFVDLSEGDFHRTDFAAGCPTQDTQRIFSELKLRNRLIDGSWHLAHAERFSGNDEPLANPQSLIRGSDGDLSNGVLDGPKDAEVGVFSVADGESSAGNEQQSDVSKVKKDQMPDAKVIASDITAAQAKDGEWLWPKEDVSVNGRFMVVVRAGVDPTLYINDKAVPATHIGERIVNRREKAQVVAWYGVELDSGENTVTVKGKDSFGNDRVLAEGMFKRPSTGTSIELAAQADSVPADGGRSLLPVTISILDDNGYPALGVYYITVESSDGSWVEPDIQDSEPGRQIRIENGERTLHFRPSSTTGDVRLAAKTGEFSNEVTIQQVAEARPLVVSGFVSANAYFTTDDIGDFSASVDLGELNESRFKGRAALFVKGTVKDDYNLTLSYDSDKDSDQQLLRDINPALHYPIHGDASIRGFEAQSRSKLYVRVERDNDSVMYGDFLTDPQSDSRDLARISRTLTGLNAVFDDEKISIRMFAAQEENTNLSEEIPGNGSALLYRVRRYPVIPNSESVELITRSRDNPGLILETVSLNRLGDYTLDDETGNLTFPSSIPTLDADQNPIFIRITYDIESGGENYTVAGVRFNREVSDKLSLGASATYDGHDTDGKTLLGVHGEYRIGSKTKLRVSLGRSDSDQTGAGSAHSISVDHQFPFAKGAITTLTHAHADEGFNNAGASVAAGRTETTLHHAQQLKNNIRLLLNANQSSSAVTDDKRTSYSAQVESHYKEWQVRAGLRQISQSTVDEDDDLITSILGLRRKFNVFGKSGQTDIEYEQDLGLASRKRVAVGAKLKLHEKVNAYSNYELTNSLLGLAGVGGDQVSEAFTAGVESKVLPSTKVYSEYRMRGVVESRDHESASGVRGDYEIQEGLKVSPHFEYIKRIGDSLDDSVSASVGLSDTRNPNSRRLLRLETRRANQSTHYGLRASMTSRINNDWTTTITDNFSRQTPEDGDPVQKHTFVAALARRPKTNNDHHMLFMYRLKQEQGVTEGVDRTAHILSTHQNMQINDKLTLSGRFGFKQDTSSYDVSEVSDFAQLIDARVTHEFTRRMSVEARAGVLSTNGMSEVRHSIGFGLNYILKRNLRINAGYNFAGFIDKDLDEQNYNASGFRFGLEYKLDEEQFNWLK